MNKLDRETRIQILSMLCEGASMRSISRITGVSINTVTKLLVDAGWACLDFHHEAVKNVKSQSVQCDEIWSFSYAKNKNLKRAKAAPYGAGDVWTWTAIDADTKLILSWYVGDRDHRAATTFLSDLRGRLANKVQLTTDGHKAYLSAVEVLDFDADYAMLIKIFGTDAHGQGRYSPPSIIGTKTETIRGNPDEAHINTSFAERHNLTMRMQMRRFTRLTNAFSKKFDNHCHALALYFFYYNWVRQHQKHRVTPAMAAGLTDKLYDWSFVLEMIDRREREALIAKRQTMLEAAE